MDINTTALPGVIVFSLKTFGDERGFFRELFRENSYKALNLPSFVQYNHSRSSKNVLRGLHYQRLHAQGKLVSVIRGAIWDVVADICPSSPTYKQWISIELSDKNQRQLYIPPGYAHGFVTLSDEVDLLYACTDYYQPNDSFSVIWNDPTLNITWPIAVPLLSDNDSKAPVLTEIKPEFLPQLKFIST